ncbi:MAG TPA: DUF2254 domain-containing protein [Solirubrobacteraceae bacterium]|nr:DUF2254 domain-containing protein [Solirubrobacteraceae bacterium]
MTSMGQLSPCAEDDEEDAPSACPTMLAVRRLSASERAPWWRARARLRELVSGSLVLIPTFYLAGAIALGVLLPALDRSHGSMLLGINAAEAESILEAVASGMIAFAGLVVSVAVLVVQFGAGQYSPRLVHVFRRDPVIKNAIGLFVAPGVYALVAAADIGGTTHDGAETLTVAVALMLMVVALAALFRFIGRLLDLMRPRQLYARLAAQVQPALKSLYPSASSRELERRPVSATPTSAVVIHPRHGEVLSAVDRNLLVRVARRADAVIEVVAQIGSYVAQDETILIVRGGRGIDERQARRALMFTDGRSLLQDPSFAIRCIVDVVVRALSAAINDPTSAVEGLDALEGVLRPLGQRPLHSAAILDDDGAVRLVVPTPDWDELLDLALSEIRWYGAGTPQVTRRLAALLDGLESSTSPGRRAAVGRHRMLLEEHLASVYADEAERAFARTPDRLGIGGRPATSDVSRGVR